MSQIAKKGAGGGGGNDPNAVHSIVTQSGTAVAVGNVINYTANDSTVNNDSGITSTASGSTFNTIITNRLQGTVSTTGNITQTLFSFTLPAAGAYKFRYEVIGFDSVSPAAAGYAINASARTNGTTATIVQTPDGDEDEDSVLRLS